MLVLGGWSLKLGAASFFGQIFMALPAPRPYFIAKCSVFLQTRHPCPVPGNRARKSFLWPGRREMVVREDFGVYYKGETLPGTDVEDRQGKTSCSIHLYLAILLLFYYR